MKLKYAVNRHSCYRLHYHLVVVTKYRNKVINSHILKDLETISKNIFNEKWNCNIVEFNGESNHIHILFEAPPQVQLSKLINNFKTVSSRLVRKNHKAHVDKFYWKPFFWSNSYLLLSVGGATIDIIKEYIENQDSPKK